MTNNHNFIFFLVGKHVDGRGTLTHFNGLPFGCIKRFYVIEQSPENDVRAWQGHKIEKKWFVPLDGAFKIVLIEPDDWTTPSVNLETTECILRADQPEVCCI